MQRHILLSSAAPGKRYTFRLYAWNAVGSSPASAPYAYTTPLSVGHVATVPGAPMVTAAAQDPATYELAVTIQAPASDGGSGGIELAIAGPLCMCAPAASRG